MQIFSQLLPIILIFITGYILKSLKILTTANGSSLLKIVFYFTLPCLILNTIPAMKIDKSFGVLPIVSALIIVSIAIISYLVSSIFNLSKSKRGVFITGTMIMNIGFILPFAIQLFGNEGLLRISIFDIGNAILTYTLTFIVAHKFGTSKISNKTMAFNLIKSVPLWALAISLCMNAFSYNFKGITQSFLLLSGNITVPLILLAMGILFTIRIKDTHILLTAVFIRMVVGLFLGYAVCKLFSFDNLTQKVVLIGASAPIGFNTIVFSEIAGLDNQFAANLTSLSIIFSFILIFTLSWFMF